MDYTKASLVFKIQKISRYIKMYGPQRTWVKIHSQLHLKQQKEFNEIRWINPKVTGNDGQIAIVGCGNFAYSVIAHYINKYKKNSIKYAYDIKKSRSLSL